MARAQGRHGEVAADLHTDFPDTFANRRRLFARAADGSLRELHLERFWPHKGRMVLKFAGVDSISDAEALVGSEIQVPRAERVALSGTAAYVSDLLGCTVWDGDRAVGVIEDVQSGAGDAPLLVIRQRAKQYLVPFAEQYLRRVDVAARRVDMALPEGMLDLDAALNEKEKRQQQG